MKGLLLFLSLFSFGLNAQIPLYEKYIQFEKVLIQTNQDTQYLYNFWATWCKPCVEELPHFVDFSKKPGNEKIKVVFVSLDSKKDSDKLKNFVAKHLPNEKVIQFTDNKYNDWIDKVDVTWSGSIPASLFIFGNRKAFYEKQFESFDDLQNTWITFLKQ
jgi:thiol-disulfide isomerase/thioredoxin